MTLSEDFNGPATLMAAFSDDDEFLGLLVDSSAGMFARVSDGWILVGPNDRQYSGATVSPVEEDFIDFFDRLDAKGVEPTAKQVSAYELKDAGTSENE